MANQFLDATGLNYYNQGLIQNLDKKYVTPEQVDEKLEEIFAQEKIPLTKGEANGSIAQEGFVAGVDELGNDVILPGGIAIGTGAIAFGTETKAEGSVSLALGEGTIALGQRAVAEGQYTISGMNGFTITGEVLNVTSEYEEDKGNYTYVYSIPVDFKDISTEYISKGTVISFSCAVKENGGWRPGIDNGLVLLEPVATEETSIYRLIIASNEIWYNSDVQDRLTNTIYLRSLPEYGTRVVSSAGHSEGRDTKALGDASHTEGKGSAAQGDYAHAEGYYTIASGGQAHAEGSHSKAIGIESHTEGNSTTATGTQAHAEGSKTTASGNYSHAEGRDSIASGVGAHAEGTGKTTASGQASHAEGANTTATGTGSHSEGYNTKATANKSHAEGGGTTASGESSHAEGANTLAKGYASHAEGGATEAISIYSHAEGQETIAASPRQHVQGKFNIEDNAEVYAHIVGGGDSEENRANAHTIEWTGDAQFAGDLYTKYDWINKTGKKIATEEYVDEKTANLNPTSNLNIMNGEGDYSLKQHSKNTASGRYSFAEGSITETSGDYAHAEGEYTKASGNKAHAEGDQSKAIGNTSHAEGYITTANGDYAHTEGYLTIANGEKSHAEGNQTKAHGYYSHAEGQGTVAGVEGNTTDNGAHAEGRYTTASGQAAHAEGNSTVASGAHSHTEGTSTKATFARAHAEGWLTSAEGDSAHAEGKESSAKGNFSHTEGQGTVAHNLCQHAQGSYNIIDNVGNNSLKGTYAHIVGNGTANDSRSNAHTLDWNGNAHYAGNVYAEYDWDNKKGKKLINEADMAITNSKIEENSKRISNLEELLITHIIDDSEAYTKIVPTQAAPNAILNSVGGKTIQKSSKNICTDAVEGGIPFETNPFFTFNYTLPKGTYWIDVKVEGDEGFESGTNYGKNDSFNVNGWTNPVTLDSEATYWCEVSGNLGVTGRIYPMIIEYTEGTEIPTEYEPYEAPSLEPTKVTEIVSVGKNLFDTNNIIKGSFGSSGEFTNGAHLLRTDNPIFVVGGETYTVSCHSSYDLRYLYFYGSNNEYISNIWMDRPTSHVYTFTVPTDAMFVNIGFEIDGASSSGSADISAAQINSKMQLEHGSVKTEYTLYREPKTYPIPEAVLNNISWGYGMTDIGYVNTYDFSTKKYTKALSDVITIDGSKLKVDYNNGFGRCLIYVPQSVSPVSKTQSKAPLFRVSHKFTVKNSDSGSWIAHTGTSDDSISAGKSVFVFILSSEYDTTAKANDWFKAQYEAGAPIQIQYPLYTPIVTDIDDDSYPNYKFIEVQGDGGLIAENESKTSVPWRITYSKTL